jgi:hypothetical protein
MITPLVFSHGCTQLAAVTSLSAEVFSIRQLRVQVRTGVTSLKMLVSPLSTVAAEVRLLLVSHPHGIRGCCQLLQHSDLSLMFVYIIPV